MNEIQIACFVLNYTRSTAQEVFQTTKVVVEKAILANKSPCSYL